MLPQQPMNLMLYSYYYRTRQEPPRYMRNIKTGSQGRRRIIQARALLIDRRILWLPRRSAPHSDESYSIGLPVLALDSLGGSFCETGECARGFLYSTFQDLYRRGLVAASCILTLCYNGIR